MPVVLFFNDTATTEIYTLSLHDALPISWLSSQRSSSAADAAPGRSRPEDSVSTSSRMSETHDAWPSASASCGRSEEHTSELQSRQYLVCRLLLEKKN